MPGRVLFICTFPLGIALAVLPSGCRLPGAKGPVSRSLATSRQLCQQGVAAIERGQWEQAEQLLSEALEACSEDPDARRHYAEVLWHRGDGEAAVGELLKAARLAGDDAILHVRLAQMRLAMGQIELARQTAQHALDLNPKLSTAWAMRGRVRSAAGQPRLALADYHRALGLAPNDRAIQLEIAQLYRQLGQPRRALAALESLADTYSPGEEPQEVLYLEGLAYAALGRHDDAVESFSAALMRGQPTPEILYRLAKAEWDAGRPTHAEAAARQALSLDPQHQPSRELLDHTRLALQSNGLPPR